VRVPGDDGDLPGAGERYEQAIEDAGGVDLQVLGIGTTGHIGFNEPGSSFASLTRVKTLTEQTRRDNARFFGSLDEVPMHCVTQGLGTILRARHLVLLAFGAGKAEAVAGAVEGPVTASLPGSAIQLHRNVTVIVDEAAASHLRFADYYRYAWEHRLDWER
jgi:glucosamine-6-phosphate deaminase